MSQTGKAPGLAVPRGEHKAFLRDIQLKYAHSETEHLKGGAAARIGSEMESQGFVEMAQWFSSQHGDSQPSSRRLDALYWSLWALLRAKHPYLPIKKCKISKKYIFKRAGGNGVTVRCGGA